MKNDVFISFHTNSSIHIVEGIVNKLESKGIKCWYAPRDVVGAYAKSIKQAINQCRVFILVLNKDSSESPHVLNELQAVTKRLSKKEKVDIMPFHIADDEISDEADYYIGRMHWIDAITPPMEYRIDELVSKITYVLEIDNMSRSDSNIDGKYYLINSRIYADNGFIGRTRELSQIHKILTSEKNKVFLVGMGGIGKSEIAKMYCQSHSDYFTNIVWISYSTSLKDIIIDDNTFPIRGICRKNYPEDTDNEYFLRKINILKSIANEKTLIVIDNFDVIDDPDSEIFCSGEYAVLFTTRYHRLNNMLNEVYVEEMSDKEQFTLFTNSYKRNISESDKPAINKILSLLDSHTLTIRLVASTMCSKRIKPGVMLEILENKDHTAQASDLIYNRLKQLFLLSDLNDDEIYLMKNLSLISLQGMEVERLYSWCEMEDYDIIDGLIQKNWVIHNILTDTVHLHPIISDLSLEKLSEDLNCCNKFLENFVLQCSNVIGTDFLYKQWLFNHAKYIYDKLPANHKMHEDILLSKIRMLSNMSLYDETIKLCLDSISRLKRTINKFIAYIILSHMYCLNFEPEKGVRVAERALEEYNTELSDKSLDEERHIYKELLSRMTEGNRSLKKFDLAIEYAYKSLNFCETHFPNDQYNTLIWAKYHLARILFMRNNEGDLNASEAIFNEAVELCNKRNDPWTANFCREFLAQILMMKGQYDEALKEMFETYDSLVMYLGKQHVSIAANLLLTGNIYRFMKNEEKAAEYYKESIQILDKLNNVSLKKKYEMIFNSGEIGYVD